MKKIHIIGIGGIGMSAIAGILHDLNYKVQGSDKQLNENIIRLRKLGIKIYIGHNPNNIKEAEIIVYSSAIKFNNVELIEAIHNKKTIFHRSDILVKIMKNKYVIAVSGSSGKTTTTAMISSIFDYYNNNIFVIVGGILNSCNSNYKSGIGNTTFLIEVDESDGTILKIPVNIGVITSINNDHIDYYGTFDNIKNAFSKFAKNSDFVVLPSSININYNSNNSIKFGVEDGDIKAINIKQYINNIKFDVLINNKFIMKNVLLSNAVGMHYVNNALAAISVALKIGISNKDIKKGLLEFKGVKRRFSVIANINGVKFIEDYAHHPSEIKATLLSAQLIAKKKIIGIIEPLRFIRVQNFFHQFIKVFMMFDYIILTSVHPLEDDPIPGYGISDIRIALIDNGFINVKIINNALVISNFIKNFTNSGDIVLFIGAGNNISKLAKKTVTLFLYNNKKKNNEKNY